MESVRQRWHISDHELLGYHGQQCVDAPQERHPTIAVECQPELHHRLLYLAAKGRRGRAKPEQYPMGQWSRPVQPPAPARWHHQRIAIAPSLCRVSRRGPCTLPDGPRGALFFNYVLTMYYACRYPRSYDEGASMAYIRSSMKVLWSPSDECFPRACGQSLVRSVGSTNALPETWAVGDQRDEGAGLSSQRMRESLTPYNNAPRWRNEEAPGARTPGAGSSTFTP